MSPGSWLNGSKDLDINWLPMADHTLYQDTFLLSTASPILNKNRASFAIFTYGAIDTAWSCSALNKQRYWLRPALL